MKKLSVRILGCLFLSAGLLQAQYTVTNTNQNGTASFSTAITQADSTPGSTIQFTNNLGTFTLAAALPSVTGSTAINGGTGNAITSGSVTPLLDFSGGTDSGSGLTLTAFTGMSSNGTSVNGGNSNAGTGGMGGTGTSGGAGSQGGVAISISGTSDTLANNQTITGGTSGSANGGSADGGRSTSGTGGKGGTGGAGASGETGGTGLAVSGNNAVIINSSTIAGGNGGSADGGSANGGSSTGGTGGLGGTGGDGVSGGTGGVGLSLSGSTGTISNGGTIRGGNGGSANGGSADGGRSTTGTGGNGGMGGDAGIGGNGGVGLFVSAAGLNVTNTGTITGGIGGTSNGGSANAGGSTSGGTGTAGTTGFSGIVGSGGVGILFSAGSETVTDSGVINGGNILSGRADAIDFTGSGNTLQLQAGYSINGNVVVAPGGATNTLVLGGATNSTFDVSRIGPAAQYQGFDTYVKTGTSTFTLTGTTTAVTPYNIQQGILEVTMDSNLGNPSDGVTLSGGELLTNGAFISARAVTVTGTGTLAATSATSGAYSGPISGGALNLGDGTNNGTMNISSLISGNGTSINQVSGTNTLSGTNTYGGGTSLQGGILFANNATALGSGALTATGGTLELDSSLSIGALSGSGATIQSATVGNTTLTITDNLTPAQTYSGQINNGGTTTLAVDKAGTGTEILTNSNAYSGGTTIGAGTLVAGNSTAFGTGAVTNTSTLKADNGTVLTLALGSTFTQQAGGTLAMTVFSNNSADRINVTNNAALGGTLSLNLNNLPAGGGGAPGTAATTRSFTLLTSSGLNGTMFNLVTYTGAPAVDNEQVTYTTNDVLLDVQTMAVLFPGSNLTPNQQAILGPINNGLTAGIMSAGFTAIDTALANLYAQNPAAFAAALNQLSPQAFGQFTEDTAFNNASFETEAMDSYLAGQRDQNGNFLAGNGGIDSSGLTVNDPSYDPTLSVVHSRMMAWNPAPEGGLLSDTSDSLLGGTDMKDSKDMKSVTSSGYTNPWNFFVRGNVILAQGFSQPGVSHFDDNTESVVLGTDYRITPNLLVGLTAGYAHTDVTLDDNNSSATVDSYSPGFYASYADKGWYANLTGDYLHNAYTQDRVIGFLGQTASSAPQGNEGVANLDGGYDFHHGALTYGPLAGVQYTHLSVDGYNETGSVADLSVNDQEEDSLRSRLGGRIEYAFSHYGMTFRPHLDASWQHEFLDQSRGITSQFGFGGGSFSVRTTDPSRDSALADVGFDADINRTVTVFTDYIVQAGQDNYFGQSVQAGVKIGF